jgi:hypothetical protein
MHIQNDSTLEDSLMEAMRRVRRLVQSARVISPGTPSERGLVSRCLADLETGRVLGGRSDSAIDALRRVIQRELAMETNGTIRVFDGFFDPDAGDVGEVRDVPLRTRRGDELAGLARLLEHAQDARDAARDRFRAEQEVRRRFEIPTLRRHLGAARPIILSRPVSSFVARANLRDKWRLHPDWQTIRHLSYGKSHAEEPWRPTRSLHVGAGFDRDRANALGRMLNG